jgi:hypothetical protein
MLPRCFHTPEDAWSVRWKRSGTIEYTPFHCSMAEFRSATFYIVLSNIEPS